jgi:hypothetical protein
MATLDKAAFLAAAAKPREVEPLEVPALGGIVYVRAMTGTERDAWERSLVAQRGKKFVPQTENVRARLLVRCLCDEQGVLLFALGDADELGKLAASILAPLYEAAQRLNGVSDADVEELGKDSAPEAGSGSPTSSR